LSVECQTCCAATDWGCLACLDEAVADHVVDLHVRAERLGFDHDGGGARGTRGSVFASAIWAGATTLQTIREEGAKMVAKSRKATREETGLEF
jgi:hypothetical protein